MVIDARWLGNPAIFRIIQDVTSQICVLDEEAVVYVDSLEKGSLLKGYTEMRGFESTLSSEADRFVVRFKGKPRYRAGVAPK